MVDSKLILVVFIVSSFSLGCTQPPGTPIPTVTQTATETTGVNETELRVNLNKEFTLSFEANPSTGYSWEAIIDGNFLKLENKTFVPYLPQIPGRGGKENFTFIPLKTGETDLVMQYKRPWEKDVLEEKIFRTIITE